MSATETEALKPRAHLDAPTIVETGLRLAASGRTNAVSFRKLGAALGVDPTAVYRHFRDKQALNAAMLDRLFESLAQEIDPHEPWRQRLVSMADRTVGVMADHACVGVAAGSSSTHGPAERALMEAVLSAFTEAGLADDQLMRFYGIYTSYVLTFASAMAAGRLAREGSWADEDNWVPVLGRVDPVEYPCVAANAARLEALSTHDVFATALGVIMDAARDAAAQNASAASTR